MNSAESFSPDYGTARAKFREAAKAAGAAIESFGHPDRGPDGGDLSTDVALIGPKAAERVLVTISATHGVEGFCGSGAQIDWLRRGEAASLPTGLAVLIIHAINPYGFAWLRRVTNENVDLNRNWIDFDQPVPENPGYDALAAAAGPAEWTEAAQAEAAQTLLGYAREHGFPALQQAVSGGQYRHPKGIFYGGAGPSWSRRTQTQIFTDYLSGAGRVGIVDYHTGLGPYGFGEQIVTDRPGTAGYDRALRWFGAAITCPAAGDSTSADIKGDNLGAAPELMPQAEVTGMALEVGVLDLTATLSALRADAWLHGYGDPTSPDGREIKRAIRDAFYGDTDTWKGMVAGQSLLACRQAIRGLSA